MKNHYLKFALMMLSSFVFMYAAMFFNVDQFDHIYLSHTRTYMALYMVGPMALIMLAFMAPMYKNKAKNAVIVVLAVLVTSLSYYFLRDQTTVKDIQYMKAMIPHHSSAILVSQQATLEDPETRALAKEIIEAQKREIAEMKKIINRLENED
ncbi:DUF305 domain-containing protein [Roseivirga sp. BDSF3-8]|uniref:DUF305 domain-containing protein n=1 Tax=Roseivirga sp. BDSF3-8 TaxID=3241598 RepID=UPI0035326C1F